MIVYDGPVLPDDLTTFVREVPIPANYVLDQILPNVYIQSNRVDVGQITRTNRTARFRAYDGRLHVAQRDNGQVTSVQLPPLSDTLAQGELERLKMLFAQTGGTNQNAFIDAIYNDGEQLTRNVNNRMELARGDVLMDGKFTMLNANDEPALESDYGVPSGNIVTAAQLWTHVTNGALDTDVLTDLNNWVTAYNTLNGFKPGGMWITQSVLNLLLANATLRTAAGTILGTSLILARAQVDQMLEQRGLPPILGVYDSLVDVDDTPTRITAANKIIFVPPAGQPLGRTVWGISATALELVNSAKADLSFEDSPGIVGVVVKEGPPFREYTFVDAVGMPVLDNPRALMVVTVA